MTAVLHALRDIGIGLAIAGMVALIAYLISEADRKAKEQIEREDLADFEAWQAQYERDWQFPKPWRLPAAEYVAKPKTRVR